MREPLIQAQGLCKSYRDGRRIDVLVDLDLEVAAGEAVAIVGQSGVGKSTLLHILGTLDQPTSGRLLVGGVNVFGGSGRITGAMLGGVLIGTLEQSLLRLSISEFWRDALLGLLILLAVASDAVILQRLRLLWARSELKLVDNPGAQSGAQT